MESTKYLNLSAPVYVCEYTQKYSEHNHIQGQVLLYPDIHSASTYTNSNNVNIAYWTRLREARSQVVQKQAQI